MEGTRCLSPLGNDVPPQFCVWRARIVSQERYKRESHLGMDNPNKLYRAIAELDRNSYRGAERNASRQSELSVDTLAEKERVLSAQSSRLHITLPRVPSRLCR